VRPQGGLLLSQGNLANAASLPSLPRAAPQRRMGRLLQSAVRRAGAGPPLCRTLYPPRGDLQQSLTRHRRRRGELRLEGLSRQQPMQDHDARRRGVHPTLPDARSAFSASATMASLPIVAEGKSWPSAGNCCECHPPSPAATSRRTTDNATRPSPGVRWPNVRFVSRGKCSSLRSCRVRDRVVTSTPHRLASAPIVRHSWIHHDCRRDLT